MMKFIYWITPYKKLSWVTNLSEQEVFERLKNNTKPSFNFTEFNFKESMLGPKMPFIGKYFTDGFSLVKSITGRNSFIPVMDGSYKSFLGKTYINIEVHLHKFVAIFICFWLAFVLFACIGILVNYFGNSLRGEFSIAFIGPFIMLVFGILLMYGGFYGSYSSSVGLLKELLEAEDAEPQSF